MRTSIPTTETESLIRIALGRRGIRGFRWPLRKHVGRSHKAPRPSVGGGCEATPRRALDWGGAQSMLAIRPRERGEETTEDAHAFHYRLTLHRREGPLLPTRVTDVPDLRGGGTAGTCSSW